MSARDLVGDLITIQRAAGETDATFAARLGVNRETWRLIRQRKIQPGPQTLRGVAAAYPGLKDAVTAFILSGDASKRAEHASTTAETVSA